MNQTTANLTDASLKVFLKYASESLNWDGMPYLDGNRKENGNLTDLKKHELIETEKDSDDPSIVWVIFTDKGKELANNYGIEIPELF